jgi:diacylglycerol kinase (ATP)
MKIKNVHIIINPASGKFEPTLAILNTAFKDTGIDWDISITKKAGDGMRFAKECADKVDMTAVYGGDGTVMEVISGLTETKTPLAILPGGTANVMAVELGIPGGLKEACELITKGPAELKKIDVAKYGRRHFILRTGMGLEAEMVRGADRTIKNHWGRLAYVISGFRALKNTKLATYHIVVDGKEHSVKGVDCIVANAGSVGFGELTMDRKIDVSDGLLDVIVLKKLDLSLFRYIGRILAKRDPSQDRALVGHWQGKDIKIEARPQQVVVCDGEVLGKEPIHTKIFPEAVEILVPKKQPQS